MPEDIENEFKPRILYNRGGHVARIEVKIFSEDSFYAMTRASDLAHEIGGVVAKLYSDVGSRANVSGASRGGVKIELGDLDDD